MDQRDDKALVRSWQLSAVLDPDDMPPWLAELFRSPTNCDDVIAGVDADDCAILKWKQELLVITTDFLNSRPIATQLGLGSLFDLGRLLVLANLSDLCGSGALPRALLAAVMMPRKSTRHDFEMVMKGICHEASDGVPVVGGDTRLGGSMALLGVAVGSAEVSTIFS